MELDRNFDRSFTCLSYVTAEFLQALKDRNRLFTASVQYSNELTITLNAGWSTCVVVVDTSRTLVHNTQCPLLWVRNTS